MNERKEIIDLFERINKQTELSASITTTLCDSLVIIFSDTDAQYEEVITIDGEHVNIISEGVTHSEHTLTKFLAILKKNYPDQNLEKPDLKESTAYEFVDKKTFRTLFSGWLNEAQYEACDKIYDLHKDQINDRIYTCLDELNTDLKFHEEIRPYMSASKESY